MSHIRHRLQMLTLLIAVFLIAACGQVAAPTGSTAAPSAASSGSTAAPSAAPQSTTAASTAPSGTTAETGATPTITIVSPQDGATVKGPTVTVQVTVSNWKLVPAGGALNAGEGHLHFFIDVPASSVSVGQVIPPTATNPAYVHAGAAPLNSRDLKLTSGKHTITVVMGNSSHIALAVPAPQSITITVQ